MERSLQEQHDEWSPLSEYILYHPCVWIFGICVFLLICICNLHCSLICRRTWNTVSFLLSGSDVASPLHLHLCLVCIIFFPPMNLCFLHACICVYLHVQQSASLFKQRGVFLAIRFTRCRSTPPLLLYCPPCLRIADGFFTFYLSRPESVRSAFSPEWSFIGADVQTCRSDGIIPEHVCLINKISVNFGIKWMWSYFPRVWLY